MRHFPFAGRRSCIERCSRGARLAGTQSGGSQKRWRAVTDAEMETVWCITAAAARLYHTRPLPFDKANHSTSLIHTTKTSHTLHRHSSSPTHTHTRTLQLRVIHQSDCETRTGSASTRHPLAATPTATLPAPAHWLPLSTNGGGKTTPGSPDLRFHRVEGAAKGCGGAGVDCLSPF